MFERLKTIHFVLFLTFLCLPVLKLTLIGEIRLIDEYRLPNLFPRDSFIEFFKYKSRYSEKIEAYFNDNFGFRDFLVRCKNQIEYTLFRKSVNLTIGKEGWLYSKSRVENMGLERKTDEEFERVYQGLMRTNRYLKERGIQFIIIPIPDKNIVYPEYLPDRIPRQPAKSAFTRYLELLQRNKDLQVVNVMQLLKQQKQKYVMFPKTDLHWTDVGAYIIASELLRMLFERSGDEGLRPTPFEIENIDFQGRQAKILAIFDTPVETVPTIRQTWTDNWTMDFITDSHLSVYKNKRQGKTGQPELPKLLHFGDSFSGNFFNRTGFPNYFAEINFNRYDDFHNLENLLHDDTNVVILMHIKTGLKDMIEKPGWWPELD